MERGLGIEERSKSEGARFTGWRSLYTREGARIKSRPLLVGAEMKILLVWEVVWWYDFLF